MLKKSLKNPNNPLYCKKCDYLAKRMGDFKKHILTRRHNANAMKTNANNTAEFACDCGKCYKHASSFSRHTRVCKTQPKTSEILTNPNKILTNPNNAFSCACGKKYKHRSTLCYHQKRCPQTQTTIVKKEEETVTQPHPLMTEDEFQNRLVKTLKEILPQMAPTIVTNNNITNKNRISNNQINIFLNEKCADAMSIQQFAKQLTFTIEDVLMKKHDALVKVINQNLHPLAVTERPVHCTNVARRRWHVKDETEGWKNDDGGLLLRKVNDSLLRKSPAQYAEAFPEFITQPKRQDEYVEIVRMTSTDLEPKAEARVLTSVGDTVELQQFAVTVSLSYDIPYLTSYGIIYRQTPYSIFSGSFIFAPASMLCLSLVISRLCSMANV